MKNIETYNYLDFSVEKQNIICPMTLSSEICFDNEFKSNWDINILQEYKSVSRFQIWKVFKFLESNKHTPYLEYLDIHNNKKKMKISKILTAYYKNISKDTLNVIAIPNKTSEWGQETLLNSINFNVRDNCKLLWKDVAQAIAYCDNLSDENKITFSKNKLHIFDWTDAELSFSSFDLELETIEYENFLVPVRKHSEIYKKSIGSFQLIIAKEILSFLRIENDVFFERYIVSKNIIKNVFILKTKNSFIAPIKSEGWKRINLTEKDVNKILKKSFAYLEITINNFIKSVKFSKNDRIIIT